MAHVRRHITVLLLFAGLTALITYPQVTALGTSVPFHPDPYFAMWRLGWVAHELLGRPTQIFEANIFYPAHDTLAYSDAMLLPGLLLAPFFRAGVHPVAIYNWSLLGSIVLSGLATFALVRRLTHETPTAVAAGVIYAFAPYRFDHYMHLELQIVFWAPLALLLVHRIVEAPGVGAGLALGALVAAQGLSCLYVAIFLAMYCSVFVPALWAIEARRRTTRLAAALAVAAAVTLLALAPYASAYTRATASVGTRTPQDVRHYGASAGSYVAAPPMNRLWGPRLSSFGADELFLFPGATALALALVGVVAAPARQRWAYVIALVATLELSRGFDGVVYPWLFSYVPPIRALRSPARIGILVNLSLAVLAGYGVAWLTAKASPRWRRALPLVVVTLLVAEYASKPALALAPQPTAVDTWLAYQPPAVVVELPLASPDSSWQSRDWVYMYQGLRHRQKMLNGYSGFAPASYYRMLDEMQAFPDDRSLHYLQQQRVNLVILRGRGYTAERWTQLVEQTQRRSDLTFAAGFRDGAFQELVFAVTP